MKTKLITAALFIVACAGAFAQTKSDLTEATAKLIYLSNKQDYEELTNLVYPKIFDAISKDNYKKEMENKMKTGEYGIYMVETDPSVDYGAIVNTEEAVYCLIYYNTVMKITLEDKIDPKRQEDVVTRFKNMLKTDEVYFDEAQNRLDATKRVSVLAVADGTTRGFWTFVLNPDDPREKNALPQSLQNGLDPDYTVSPENMVKPQEPTPASPQSAVERAAAEKAALAKKKKNN